MEEYLRYVYSDSVFFKDCLENIISEDVIKVNNLPTGWKTVLSEDKVWINYYPENLEIDDQGWKLHISCSYRDTLQVLKSVSDVLIEMRIPFKNIYTRQIFDIIHSKNANRITAGKFITIYPRMKDLQKTVEKLYEVLCNFDKGCYILSDKRYKDSNIYYRYGAFKNMIIGDKHCIKDLDGNYIEDLRKPYFTKPYFVDIPEFLIDDIDEKTNSQTKLSEYSIEKAIKFSASGGIYFAYRKVDRKPVVIKEARNAIGLDSEGFNAIQRLRNEYDMLNLLKDSSQIVNTIDYFKVWENEYLVEEYLDGISLSSWVAMNYPFAIGKNKDLYIDKVKYIIEQISLMVEYVHSKGIGISDLQPNNISINDNLDCKFIDFESSGDINESYNGLGTHGFSMGISNRLENDNNAKKNILKYLLLPVAPVDLFDNSLERKHVAYIRKIFGDKVNDEFHEYFNYNSDIEFNDINLKEIKNKLLNGLKNHLLEDGGKILSYGDVYSYLNLGGHYNYLTGGMGIIYTLFINDMFDDYCKKWIDRNSMEFFNCRFGLLDGQMGICNILYMVGYRDLATNILQNIAENIDEIASKYDISIYSGLAGVILGYTSIYKLNGDKSLMTIAINIANAMIKKIDSLIGEDAEENAVEYDFVHGLSGSAFSLLNLYELTKNDEFYNKGIRYLNESLNHLELDNDSQIMQLKLQDNRVIPYLENGSIGIALVIYFIREKFSNKDFDYFFEKISNTINLSIFYDASLFFGMGSTLLMGSMFQELEFKDAKSIIDLVKLYLVCENGQCMIPGRAAMKLSNDVYTGGAGIVLGINAFMEKNPFLWLPIKF